MLVPRRVSTPLCRGLNKKSKLSTYPYGKSLYNPQESLENTSEIPWGYTGSGTPNCPLKLHAKLFAITFLVMTQFSRQFDRCSSGLAHPTSGSPDTQFQRTSSHGWGGEMTERNPLEIPSWELTYPPQECTFENDFPFPQVGYVSSLEGTLVKVSKSF